jgi:hypothetical protein
MFDDLIGDAKPMADLNPPLQKTAINEQRRSPYLTSENVR